MPEQEKRSQPSLPLAYSIGMLFCCSAKSSVSGSSSTAGLLIPIVSNPVYSIGSVFEVLKIRAGDSIIARTDSELVLLNSGGDLCAVCHVQLHIHVKRVRWLCYIRPTRLPTYHLHRFACKSAQACNSHPHPSN